MILVVVASGISASRVSLESHGLSPAGKKGRRDRDVTDRGEQGLGGSSRCMGRTTRMQRDPRTQHNRFVHPDTLVCQHAATTRTRTHARTYTQNLTDSSTSTRLRALQRTHEPLHRASAHVHSEKSPTHTARTPLLSKWVPGCCEHGGTPNQTGSGDAYRISSSCTITKLPCQPPLALHTLRSNLVSTGYTRTTVQRSPRVRAVCVDDFSECTCARARCSGSCVR